MQLRKSTATTEQHILYFFDQPGPSGPDAKIINTRPSVASLMGSFLWRLVFGQMRIIILRGQSNEIFYLQFSS